MMIDIAVQMYRWFNFLSRIERTGKGVPRKKKEALKHITSLSRLFFAHFGLQSLIDYSGELKFLFSNPFTDLDCLGLRCFLFISGLHCFFYYFGGLFRSPLVAKEQSCLHFLSFPSSAFLSHSS